MSINLSKTLCRVLNYSYSQPFMEMTRQLTLPCFIIKKIGAASEKISFEIIIVACKMIGRGALCERGHVAFLFKVS